MQRRGAAGAAAGATEQTRRGLFSSIKRILGREVSVGGRMPVFPSKEWCEEAIALLNADPESARRGRGWNGDFGVVIEAEPGKLSEPFVVHVRARRTGSMTRFKVLRDPDELEEIEPAYLARAPYSVWKGLLLGTLDPVEAVLQAADPRAGGPAAADRADALQGHRGPGAGAAGDHVRGRGDEEPWTLRSGRS